MTGHDKASIEPFMGFSNGHVDNGTPECEHEWVAPWVAQPYKLVSLLDIMGGGTVCTKCGATRNPLKEALTPDAERQRESSRSDLLVHNDSSGDGDRGERAAGSALGEPAALGTSTGPSGQYTMADQGRDLSEILRRLTAITDTFRKAGIW